MQSRQHYAIRITGVCQSCGHEHCREIVGVFEEFAGEGFAPCNQCNQWTEMWEIVEYVPVNPTDESQQS